EPVRSVKGAGGGGLLAVDRSFGIDCQSKGGPVGRRPQGGVDRGEDHRLRRAGLKGAGEFLSGREPGGGARRRRRSLPGGGRCRLETACLPGRPDGKDRFASFVYRVRHLGGDPASGRNVLLQVYRRDQQRPECADLQDCRLWNRRGPFRDSAALDGGGEEDQRGACITPVVGRRIEFSEKKRRVSKRESPLWNADQRGLCHGSIYFLPRIESFAA